MTSADSGSADDRAAAVGRAAAYMKSCTGAWCEITGKNFDGWIRQERLWGVYPNEKVE